jgi:hypothetical protein
MATPAFAADKFPDEALQRFAAGDSREPVSVLIELDLPEPQVRPEVKKFSGGPARWRPAEVLPEAPEDRAEAERRAREAGDFLEEVLGEQPLWLPAAHVYAAQATPGQLRRIAQAPYVRAIHPNRAVR